MPVKRSLADEVVLLRGVNVQLLNISRVSLCSNDRIACIRVSGFKTVGKTTLKKLLKLANSILTVDCPALRGGQYLEHSQNQSFPSWDEKVTSDSPTQVDEQSTS